VVVFYAGNSRPCSSVDGQGLQVILGPKLVIWPVQKGTEMVSLILGFRDRTANRKQQELLSKWRWQQQDVPAQI
jgi:hypothetical protein